MRARADARSVFQGTLPAPSPTPLRPPFSSCRGCPARAAVRGRGFPCASSCTSRSVSGGREEDWGSHLFLGNIPPVPKTQILPGRPRPPLLSPPPSPTGTYPFRAALQPRLFPLPRRPWA